MNYDDWKLEGPEEQSERLAHRRWNDERDPDTEMEEREERKRITMEMDGPHEEGP